MIEWNGDPAIFRIGAFAPRWYGMMFFIGFWVGQNYLTLNFKRIGKTQKDSTKLFIYIFVATVVGSRLGHCLFYAPEYYMSNLLEIPMVWKGGLASHGGYAAVLFSIWLFVKQTKNLSFLCAADIIGPAALFTGGLVRIGNFFNSEIVGKVTDLPWAVVFKQVDIFPRHPAQLYEAIGYLTISFSLFYLYRFESWRKKEGATVGTILFVAFVFRFFIEFVKENQSTFEHGMFINMGQILSIPMALLGLVLVVWSYRKTD